MLDNLLRSAWGLIYSLRLIVKKKDARELQRQVKVRRVDSRINRAVKVRYVAVPNALNAKERLSRAIAILLKARTGRNRHER